MVQTQLGLPKLTQNNSTHGKGKTSLTYQKTQNNFLRIFENVGLYTTWGINTGLTGLQGLRASIHKCESAMRQPVCVPLTCLLVCLLVWPDDRAEVGEDQCAQSTGSFLWSTVVVEGVLAQHEPVPTLLDPVASHLPQQPPFKKVHTRVM